MIQIGDYTNKQIAEKLAEAMGWGKETARGFGNQSFTRYVYSDESDSLTIDVNAWHPATRWDSIGFVIKWMARQGHQLRLSIDTSNQDSGSIYEACFDGVEDWQMRKVSYIELDPLVIALAALTALEGE